jgi:hypothetical protein
MTTLTLFTIYYANYIHLDDLKKEEEKKKNAVIHHKALTAAAAESPAGFAKLCQSIIRPLVLTRQHSSGDYSSTLFSNCHLTDGKSSQQWTTTTTIQSRTYYIAAAAAAACNLVWKKKMMDQPNHSIYTKIS